MAQTLLIGLGGTGSRVVNNVVKELHANKKEINDGNICCAVLDTNVNDNDEIIGSGTGVPVIPTSRAKRIRGYLEEYPHLQMETWCPKSPAFLEESMIDGASELRVKSRIAFMDCMETGVIGELELMINEVLKNGSDSKIRIMIVSSLSGGTGSGMFIQVALWLRQFLRDSEIMIRGIFLLPDVFISTIKDIRDNKVTTVRHYCNAYAAIKELNAISKIRNNGTLELPERISLGKLFDSLKDCDTGKPVYDFAFFVDNRDENGVVLDSIGDYERMVAQLVYMQLYAPMAGDMYSEEDNAFLSFIENDEPLYGSCGTAKAVYPRKSVKTYCSLRAAQDSLQGGWNKIDSEIKALQKEKELAEQDGIYTNEVFDPRDKYMSLFLDKIAVRPEDAGKDRFFVSIAKDIKEQIKHKGEGGKIIVKDIDKVDAFVKELNGKKIDAAVTKHCGTSQYAIDADMFVAADHDKKALLDQVRSDEDGLAEVLTRFEKNAEGYADTIVNAVFPYSMGDVNASNPCTVYGLLAKQDDMGKWNFVHPVAARYMLYKLAAELNRGIRKATLKDSKEEALSGGDLNDLFDNKATNETEITPTDYLDSKKWNQRESKFLDEFERRYAQFITTKIALCEKYEKEVLTVAVYKKLLERVNGLIAQLEAFFAKLDDVQTKLDDAVAKNASETKGVVGKTMYVYGDAACKEQIYQSLNMEVERSNHEVNKTVIDAIYGRLCAEKRPSIPENKKYESVGVVNAFISGIVMAFRKKIDGDKNNSEQVNLDIYTAVCKESDARQAIAEEEKRQKDLEEGKVEDPIPTFDDIDLETGEIVKKDGKAQRYAKAFQTCKNKLFTLSAPFLRHTTEISKDEKGTVTTRTKTFWGFSPDIAAAYPGLGKVLGVNADLQADDAYPKNELYCYRAVYGMEAKYIPKFNELEGGDYYSCYKMIINEMSLASNGRQGERALVRSPHLDKNWHKILPAVKMDQQRLDALNLYRGLWLAIAYGMLRVDENGKFFIRREVDVGYGEMVEDDVPVLYKNKRLGKTDVVKLLEALQADKVFVGLEIPLLEKKMREELEDMENYVDTKLLGGLMPKADDLHPINLIARYSETQGHDRFVSKLLIAALEGIMLDLAKAFHTERNEQKLEAKKYELCKRIYDSGTRIKGLEKVFEKWNEKFAEHKLTKK